MSHSAGSGPEPTKGSAPARPVGEEEGEDLFTRSGRRRAQKKERRGGIVGFLRETGIVLGTALILSLLIKTFLAQAFFIPSGSMENTLDIGDRVMVSLLTPGPMDLKRGDVVVFKDPGGWLSNAEKPHRGAVQQAMVDALTFVGVLPHDSGQHLIKRVIGLPGDKVKCCDAQGRISVNGTPIDEQQYLATGVQPSADDFSVTVPAGRLWVMGDNRSNSEDSRAHWVATGHDIDASTVPESNVVGRAVFVFYPWEHHRWLSDYQNVFGKVPAPSK